MRIENELKLDFKDVLLRPKRSTLGSRKEVNLEREFKFSESLTWKGIPIIAANMDGVGTFKMAEVLSKYKMMTCLKKTYTSEQLIDYFSIGSIDRQMYSVISIGISDDDLIKFTKVYNEVGENISFVCIDVANGYSQRFLDFIKKIKDTFPDVVIMAGNVVTGEMTEELILSGVSIAKCGIGGGSVCTTRIQSGVGYPQLSTIIECADAAHGLGGFIISDGGCTCSGDIAKAFGGGSDFVMLGGMLAGHDEGGGNTIEKFYKTNEVEMIDEEVSCKFKPIMEKKIFVEFYGMSSKKANEKHFGGLKDYRAAEGREVLIPYRGPVKETVQEILGGLRSSCTYIGAKNLKNFSKCTTFVRVTQQYNPIFVNHHGNQI